MIGSSRDDRPSCVRSCMRSERHTWLAWAGRRRTPASEGGPLSPPLLRRRPALQSQVRCRPVHPPSSPGHVGHDWRCDLAASTIAGCGRSLRGATPHCAYGRPNPTSTAAYLRGLPRMKCAEAKQPEHADARVYTFRGHGRRSTVEWKARTTSRTAVSRLSVVQSHVILSSRATVTSSGTAPALTSGRDCVIVAALTER
jgi:hypothetical protein